MNKKFFTLLAASLMLMIAAAANAQFPLVGDTVTYLPGGQGTSAYHLQITYLGNNNPQDSLWVLALDDNGYVFRGDSTLLRNDLQNDVPFYKRLRQALWCVTTESPSQGRRPTFQFVNKEIGRAHV